eukprot:Seg1359.7 transcript_id=Seg1359.7/GoldUCD/mRNA.D3Y31 product="Myosin essential light chain" protein_id=Seg1359.7/GoldUCD/D3Y31
MAEIDDDQIEDMKDCYSIFDKRGDMKVESERLIDVLRSLGLNPLSEDVDKCIDDSKLKGERVDFETFFGIYKFIVNKPSVGSYADLIEGLKTLDRDASGLVFAAELRHVLMNVADKMTDVQVNESVAPHETPEGQIPYEALIKSVMAG